MNNDDNFSQTYYPEDLFYDEKTQKFQKVKNQENISEKTQKNEKNTTFFNKNGIFNENLLSKVLGGNEMLSKVFGGGGLADNAKNNLIMQALSNFNSNKKENSEKKIIVEDDDFFEEF